MSIETAEAAIEQALRKNRTPQAAEVAREHGITYHSADRLIELTQIAIENEKPRVKPGPRRTKREPHEVIINDKPFASHRKKREAVDIGAPAYNPTGFYDLD